MRRGTDTVVASNLTAASKGTITTSRHGQAGNYRTLLTGELDVFVREAKKMKVRFQRDIEDALDSLYEEMTEGKEDAPSVSVGAIQVFGFSQGSGIEIYYRIDNLAKWAEMLLLKRLQKMGYSWK